MERYQTKVWKKRLVGGKGLHVGSGREKSLPGYLNLECFFNPLESELDYLPFQ